MDHQFSNGMGSGRTKSHAMAVPHWLLFSEKICLYINDSLWIFFLIYKLELSDYGVFLA